MLTCKTALWTPAIYFLWNRRSRSALSEFWQQVTTHICIFPVILIFLLSSPCPYLAALRCVGSKVAAIQREKVRSGWARVVCCWCGHSLCASNLYSANIGLFFASKCWGIETTSFTLFSLIYFSLIWDAGLSNQKTTSWLFTGWCTVTTRDTCADVVFRHIVTTWHELKQIICNFSSRIFRSRILNMSVCCMLYVNLHYVTGYKMGFFPIAQSHYALLLCLPFLTLQSTVADGSLLSLYGHNYVFKYRRPSF